VKDHAVEPGGIVRAILVHDVFRQYLDARREFNVVLERCSVKGWPDKKADLRMSFRLQELFLERMALRLNHLQNSASEDAVWKSYTTTSAVHERVQEGWKDSDEETLAKKDAAYAALQKEIGDLTATLDPPGLEGPFQMVKGDSELIAAAHDFDRKVRALDGQLSEPRR
jgi:hypothetical protein